MYSCKLSYNSIKFTYNYVLITILSISWYNIIIINIIIKLASIQNVDNIPLNICFIAIC